jgi:hypothetical protein
MRDRPKERDERQPDLLVWAQKMGDKWIAIQVIKSNDKSGGIFQLNALHFILVRFLSQLVVRPIRKIFLFLALHFA